MRLLYFFFFSSRRRHTRCSRDWSSDVCSSDLLRVREVRIPEMEWTVATQLVTLRAEASAFHRRWISTQARAYGSDVRIRLQLGALVGGSDYVLAQRMRARIRTAIARAFD